MILQSARIIQAVEKNLLFLLLLCLCLFQAGDLCGEPAPQPVQPGSADPYQFEAGKRTSYELEYTSTSASDLSALFDQSKTHSGSPSPLKQAFNTRVRGELTLTVLAKGPEGVSVVFRFHDPKVTLIANGQDASADAAIIRGDLQKNVFALLNPQGRILSVLIDPTVKRISTGYIRSLLAITQFVFPEGGQPESGKWNVQEDDPNGVYSAEYQQEIAAKTRTVAPSSTAFIKNKVRYLQPPKKPLSRSNEIASLVVPKGKLHALFDFANGRLVSISGTESQDFLVNKKKVGHARNTIRFSFRSSEELNAEEMSSLSSARAALTEAATPAPLSAKPSPEETRTATSMNDLGDSTLETLLADLTNAESTAGPQFDFTPLFLKFRALGYLHPEACKSMGDVLGDAKADSLTMKVLSLALNAIGSADAQAALASAIKKHATDRDALYKLLFQISTVERPTPLAEDTLRDLSYGSADPQIKAMGQLSLGSMARRLALTAPERAAAIVDRFTSELASASSNDAKRQLLLALGNAGAPASVPAIARFKDDEDPDLRGVVVRALRFIESAEAEGVILRALASDAEASVRLQAADTLANRQMTPEAFKAQINAFEKDKDDNVRLSVLNNLWKVHDDFPEVNKLVKLAATKDKSKSIRNAAADIMAKYPEGYFK